MSNFNINLDPEQTLAFEELEDDLFFGAEFGDMQKREDFHGSNLEEEELFKSKNDENMFSLFSGNGSELTVTGANHNISTVPNWMTNGFNFAGNPDSDNFEFEAKSDPANVAVTTGLSQDFSDENLKHLSVKELNKLIKQKGLSKDDIAKVKYQRRTIKNRGYAQSCRIKRIKQKQSLEEKNLQLLSQVETLKQQLETVTKERDEFKDKYKQIKQFVLANLRAPKFAS